MKCVYRDVCYSLNRNWAAYKIEQVAGNCDFTLYDERTVKRLIVEDPDLMPNYPSKKALKRDIDLEYGKKQITASVTNGILQGKSIPAISRDLMLRMSDMNQKSAIRAARTATTGAENAGRLDSYAAAEERGIKLKKQWLSTLDGKTRHSHAQLDETIVERDKPFANGCMYPGDPRGAPAEVYNCRCTMIAVLDDEPYENAQRRARDPETGRNVIISDMSYDEWKTWKKEANKVAKPVKSDTIKEKVKTAKYIQFDNGDAANDFFYYDGDDRGLLAKKRSKHAQWQKSLTESEDYAIGYYTGGGYYDINAYLRKKEGWENINAERVESRIKALDSAIGRYDLKDNIRVQRGVMEDALDDLKSQFGNDNAKLIGKVYEDKAFMSATVLHGNGIATAKPVILDIEIQAGLGRGAYVNQLAGQYQDTEYEFLINRGSKFMITDIEVNEESIPHKTIIKMRLIDDEHES